MTALLTIENLVMRFGGLLAIDHVGFSVRPQQITAVIGPNGAGKTTVFNCLTGFYAPCGGSLALAHGGHVYRLEAMRGHRIASEARIARTFQNIRLFGAMTALENLMVAQHNMLMRASGFCLAGLLKFPGYRRAERQALDRARYWLDKTSLLDKADCPASSLPYGDQRRLEIARAMCTDPALLCLDEPAAGLNPKESADLNRLLLDIRDTQRISLLLIEHDMSVVMNISDHIVVLEYGRKIADGAPDCIRRDPAVIRAYLGEEEPGDEQVLR